MSKKDCASWRGWWGRLIGIPAAAVVVFSGSVGCTLSPAIPEGRYQQALRLVDDGTHLLRARRLIEADASFSMAADLAPLASAVDGRGCVAMMSGDYVSAEKFFVSAYEMDRTYDEALGNLALLYDVTGDMPRAREVYEMLFETLPGNTSARNNYAAVLYGLGSNISEVEHELRKAAALSGNGVIADNITKVAGATTMQRRPHSGQQVGDQW